MKQTLLFPLLRCFSFVVASAATTVSWGASAAAEPQPTLPVDILLNSVSACATNWKGEPEMRIKYTFQSRDNAWVLAGSENRKNGGQDAFSYYYWRNLDTGDLEVVFFRPNLPKTPRVALDETLHVIRSKKGPMMVSPVFPIEGQGTFEVGGMRFEYEGRNYQCIRSGAGFFQSYPGMLKIKYPKSVSIASLVLVDDKGCLLSFSPALRTPGESVFTLLGGKEYTGKAQLEVTLSQKDETLAIPLHETLSLGSVPELAEQRKNARNSGLPPLPAAVKQTSASTAELEFEGVCVMNQNNVLKEKGCAVKFAARVPGGLIVECDSCPVKGRDAEGNEMTGFLEGYPHREGDGERFRVSVNFPRLPKGDWIELDAVLQGIKAKKLRVCEPVALAADKEGEFMAGEVTFTYGNHEEMLKGRELEWNENCLVMSFPVSDCVDKIELRGADGRDIENLKVTTMKSIDLQTEIHFYEFKKGKPKDVYAVVTLREDPEPCLVRLKKKVGLAGFLETEEK